MEKEDFPEKSTAQYSDMPCRGSLQNEVVYLNVCGFPSSAVVERGLGGT